METRIKIIYTSAQTKEQFGEFQLSFVGIDGRTHTTSLKFNPKDLWSFARDVDSVAFDFLVLAFIVYNADRAVNRIVNSAEGWKRCFILENVPAVNFPQMNKGKELFQRAINFLTGDDWQINFVQTSPYNYSPTQNNKNYNRSNYAKVSLFSGGLDSLIGFVDIASSLIKDTQVLLVSHMELGKEHSDQEEILQKCINQHFYEGKYTQLLLNAGLKQNSWSVPTPSEGTFRSRSLLFFAAGIYVAHSISQTIPLIVPENGTISLNIPLDCGRRSSCSTRTTHPTFIKRLVVALRAIGINNPIENPYAFKSKADMMLDCCTVLEKKNILQALAPLSCSCAKRGHNSFWDKSSEDIKTSHINHCGMCLPCLYRRVALDSVGWDLGNSYGTDVFHGTKYNLENKKQKRNRDFNALLRFIRFNMNEEYIRRELRLNGITEDDGLSKYVQFALHSYEQVKQWIRHNGSEIIKNKAGIQ